MASAVAPIDTELSQSGTPSAENSSPSSPMDHATLLQAVRKQVEYYFSKENLQSDTFLMSQMDASNSVSIAVVMKFSKMKTLVNGDEALLREALRDSAVCPVTEDGRIKAQTKTGGRSTIILREVPADTSEAAVREIFNFEGCKRIASLRSDIENTWFVEMDNETDAKDTLLDLKLKRRQFNGETVKARLKTEVSVRSFYSQPPPPMPVNVGGMRGYQVQNGMQGMPMPMSYGYQIGSNGSPVNGPGGNISPAGGSMFGYGMQGVDPNLISGTGQMSVSGEQRGPSGGNGGNYGGPMPTMNRGNNGDEHGKGGALNKNQNQRGKSGSEGDRSGGGRLSAPAQGGNGGRAGGDRSGPSGSSNATNSAYPNSNGGRAANANNGKPVNNSPPSGGRQGPNDPRAANGQQAAGGGASKNAKGKQPQGKAGGGGGQVINVDLNLQNFPPLDLKSGDESPVPQVGYQSTYQKYTADEIIAIVSTVREAAMPMGTDGKVLNPLDHTHSMTATPNMDLLKRQRSFSIDETREQLQQGKPVQREAVMSGAVDYASMIYGDPRFGSESIPESAFAQSHMQPAVSTGTVERGSAPGSANRSRSNSDAYGNKVTLAKNSSGHGKGGSPARGANAVPSASSWAQLVKSSATVSSQTETAAKGPVVQARASNSSAAAAAAAAKDISSNSQNSKGTATATGKGSEGGNTQRSRSGSNAEKEAGKNRNHNHKKKDAHKVCLPLPFTPRARKCVCLWNALCHAVLCCARYKAM